MFGSLALTHTLSAATMVCCIAALFAYAGRAEALEPVPDKTVVLTFDDAVRSHLEFVAPLLKEHGFQATFFVSHLWLKDRENFLSWEEVGKLHEMGFEVGNHSWTHANFGQPRMAARLHGELALVETELKKVGVPKPVSFAWPGNGFGPEALKVLQERGYRFARRGMQPEVPYGEAKPGPLYDPAAYHPLLMPTAGDAYPEWSLDAFRNVVDRATGGKIAVVQFHGVPDVAHPWVHTPPERFREYMQYLKDGGFNVIAMRDLARYVDTDAPPKDAMAFVHYTGSSAPLELSAEMTATRADLDYWLRNMLADHRFSMEEAGSVCGYSAETLKRKMGELGLDVKGPAEGEGTERVLPYPGGRHPRIGFLEGAIDPMRGTKVTLFPPWKDGGYIVVDMPEAIFTNLGLTYLAHTHIPTIWDDADVILDNIDWTRLPSGELTFERALPNGIRFGSRVVPQEDGAELELWLENGTEQTLKDMRAQVCVMLAGAAGFEAQSNEHKRYGDIVAAAPNVAGDRWVLIAFDNCQRAWGNEDVPCIHSDPALPKAKPGKRVQVKGRVWFYEGKEPEQEIARFEGK